MHQFFPERLITVHEFQFAEGRQDQISLNFLDLTEGCNRFADYIVAHDSDAVIGAACAVVKVPFPAQIFAPVRKEIYILPLHLFPYHLPLRFRVMQGDFRLYLFLAGFGI